MADLQPQGSRPNSERDVLEEVERLIASLMANGDPRVREDVSSLLEGIDAVHRTGLTHLVTAIHGIAGDALLNRLLTDPAIRLLLMSYDLVAVDRRLQAEEALDAVRGHLHAHGVDVEILEVVGGVVYVRLHGAAPAAIASVQADLEAALRQGFVGFQELVLRERPHAEPAFVPLSGLRRPNRPVYREVMPEANLPAGRTLAVEIDGQPILLANVGGEIYAIRNRCGSSPLPLEFSQLHEAELSCSWHGCRYDVRSGRRLDLNDERLQVFPVSTGDGTIRVALDVSPLEAGSPRDDESSRVNGGRDGPSRESS